MFDRICVRVLMNCLHERGRLASSRLPVFKFKIWADMLMGDSNSILGEKKRHNKGASDVGDEGNSCPGELFRVVTPEQMAIKCERTDCSGRFRGQVEQCV